ncbi:MAG: glycosyltransferase family 4 protein [Candidatus Eisenbacteria bacterium]|nr:glycosyltransferase family 4 protein [Candidatus Eisenbacteria bacterium]
MKILMQSRFDLLADKGGDTVHVLKTKEELEKLGVSVDVSTEFAPDLKQYDLVHLFNLKLVESTYLQFLNARRQEKPVCFSPIYWRLTEEESGQFHKQQLFAYGRLKVIHLQRAKERLKKIEGLWPLFSWYTRKLKTKRFQPAEFYRLRREPGEKRMQLEVLCGSAILLPNSESEMSMVREYFGVEKDYIVVPNGVDPCFENGNADAFCNKYHLRDFILCVARIEERKNQLSIIRALGDMSIPLVFIGAKREPYFSRCAREAGGNVHFLGHMEGVDLADAYAAARAHVTASWYETPGLSNLEAALAGRSIVVSTKGSTRDYFGDHAEYCDPYDVNSIREAVVRALERRPSKELRELVRSKYSWEKAAQSTLTAYQKALRI